ncbi:hypothetical protein F4V43_16875 [Paenibacillus spiritus]|uniref:Uncharacterized protein n=1 Tax=Paenibacillus spiritus TaxID=2496557 RepID=A0A5J5FWD7_9BACL|nr:MULTISPECIES: hypothetical protein [Paenibacillus]KAA8997930.1 hypothetical protein F4V43_16875 [Paenibacillus spiritus]
MNKHTNGFTLSVAGLALVAVSIYHTLTVWNTVLFMVGLFFCFMPFDLRFAWEERKGNSEMKPTVSFGFLVFVVVGFALILTSLADDMKVVDLLLFGVGLALMFNPLIRSISKKK